MMVGYWVTFREDGTPMAFSGLPFPGAVWVMIDHHTLETCKLENEEWVPRGPEPEPEPEPEPKGRLARLNDWLWGH